VAAESHHTVLEDSWKMPERKDVILKLGVYAHKQLTYLKEILYSHVTLFFIK
jgi:hypothetical protein